MKINQHHKGFTLIELIIVILMILFVASIITCAAGFLFGGWGKKAIAANRPTEKIELLVQMEEQADTPETQRYVKGWLEKEVENTPLNNLPNGLKVRVEEALKDDAPLPESTK
ncbi:MAG: type II secretion system protein [Rickettsiales bacterium]|nr:type II secretion system protein [Rickettsiales bacterium]